MKQKRTLYSLLLTSFILVFVSSYSFAQDVTVDSKNSLRCQDGSVNITVNNPADIAAFEIVLEVSSVSGGAFFDAVSIDFDAGFAVLTTRIIDLSGVDYASPDTIRIAGMLIDAGDACLTAGATTVATLNFTTNDACSGDISIAGGTFVDPFITASTQFADCATLALIPAAVNAGTITIINSAPSIESIADASLPWGTAYVGSITAADADEASCEVLTYSKVSGPTAMTVNAVTGTIVWATTGADVCTYTVEVQVEDACGAIASTSFEICVTNQAPSVTCPAGPLNNIWGDVVSGSASGDDPDSGPSALLYTVSGFSGPGAVNIDAATGDWSWATMEDNSYIGCFELSITVTDGANTCDPCSPVNSDVCTVEICVMPTIAVTIEKTHKTIQGLFETVSINLDDNTSPANEMGGYDLLISYDASALSLNGATPGQLVLDCGWEYFTYRYGASGNCGDNACPSGKVRLVAIAETNNGQNHPLCFISAPGQLAELSFLVTNDRTFECQYVPIRFCWYDCGDNAISSVTGDTLYISRYVYNYDNGANQPSIAGDYPFPSYYGANSTCDTAVGDGKPDQLRIIDFQNGGIDIVCADSIDARGDINFNEVAYEIADAVLLSNYFVYGLVVFNINLNGQIAASDVNADGLTLSVADLVYLIRVVVGDALPYPKEVTSVTANYVLNNEGVLSISDDLKVGAAYVVVSGESTPELKADNMEMLYNYDGTNTRILVYSLLGNSFTGDFLSVNGEIVSLEMATKEGNPIDANLIPTEFALMQNYPNPFNPSTTISFNLPKASDYVVNIYNVNGQKVAVLSGSGAAGSVELLWDAGQNASGVYFYQLEVEDLFSQVKKMVLLK